MTFVAMPAVNPIQQHGLPCAAACRHHAFGIAISNFQPGCISNTGDGWCGYDTLRVGRSLLGAGHDGQHAMAG